MVCLLGVQNRLGGLGHVAQVSFKLYGSLHMEKMTRFYCVFIVHCVAVSSSLFGKSQKTFCFLTDVTRGENTFVQ